MVHERPDGAPPTTLHVFARFCVREGEEEAVAAAIQEVLVPSRNEPGCLRAEAFRSTKGRHTMVIHSVWRDEMAFDEHAQMPHTRHFIDRVEALISHPLDVTRTRSMD
jgi:quinol monooxygenase YgiN